MPGNQDHNSLLLVRSRQGSRICCRGNSQRLAVSSRTQEQYIEPGELPTRHGKSCAAATHHTPGHSHARPPMKDISGRCVCVRRTGKIVHFRPSSPRSPPPALGCISFPVFCSRLLGQDFPAHDPTHSDRSPKAPSRGQSIRAGRASDSC